MTDCFCGSCASGSRRARRNITITNFVVFVRDGGATIRLDASSPIRFKHLELTSPARVVVDLHGTWKLSSYFYFSRQFLQQYLYIVVNKNYIVYYSS